MASALSHIHKRKVKVHLSQESITFSRAVIKLGSSITRSTHMRIKQFSQVGAVFSTTKASVAHFLKYFF